MQPKALAWIMKLLGLNDTSSFSHLLTYLILPARCSTSLLFVFMTGPFAVCDAAAVRILFEVFSVLPSSCAPHTIRCLLV